jgi:hypothetical protein
MGKGAKVGTGASYLVMAIEDYIADAYICDSFGLNALLSTPQETLQPTQ